jgi:hypothetical protein
MIRDKLPMLATLQLLAVNFAANIVPINGYNTGVLSDMYPTGFTPPGWVFSIWLLIYIGLLAYSVAAWRAPSRLRARAASVANLYYVNALANSAWIFAWHYRQVLLSVLIMLVILGTLAAIFWKLRNQPRPTWAEYFRVDAPFSLYFGWITAATLVNFGALCFERGMWPLGLSMDEWALVTVCLASGIYAITTTVTRDAVFGGVFVWASLGIATKAAGITMSVQLAAASGIVVVLVCIARAAIARRERPRYA